MHPEFLIDANCLVTPNNDYYRPDFRLSQQFWEHLQQLVMNGGIGVISQVAHEVAVGSGSGDCSMNGCCPSNRKLSNPVAILRLWQNSAKS